MDWLSNVYTLENKDQLDIQSTNKSVYGYLAIGGKYYSKINLGQVVSINTKANIGSNNGKKLKIIKKLNILKINKEIN